MIIHMLFYRNGGIEMFTVDNKFKTALDLSTIDLVKQLPSKRLFSKFLFEALEMKGYGENVLRNKNTRFIHNEKFENEFIKTGLCRASATNMYTWSPKMIDYIVEGDMLKLMQQISKIWRKDR